MHDQNIRCVMLMPAIGAAVPVTCSSEEIYRLDDVCTRTANAVYIHGDRTPDIVAFRTGPRTAQTCSVEGTVLCCPFLLVGIEDDGDTYCSLNPAQIRIAWHDCTEHSHEAS